MAFRMRNAPWVAFMSDSSSPARARHSSDETTSVPRKWRRANVVLPDPDGPISSPSASAGMTIRKSRRSVRRSASLDVDHQSIRSGQVKDAVARRLREPETPLHHAFEVLHLARLENSRSDANVRGPAVAGV